ncbi:MAG: PKD domain-containing protein [Candidatus Altiarchaeota archaeon]|nr:PKD domain-containing protein [Candidatus Altiarchaeota archaeon]
MKMFCSIQKTAFFLPVLFAISLVLAETPTQSAVDMPYALPPFINNLMCLILWVLPSLMALLVVIGGLFYMFGSVVNREQGKKIIVNAVIGFIIAVGLTATMNIVYPEIDPDRCLNSNQGRNKDPVADARVSYKENPVTYKFAYVTIGNKAYFDGSKSYDPDGKIVKHIWDIGDGTILSGERTEHIYEKEGMYYAVLTVEDDYGRVSIPGTVTVMVNPPVEATPMQ